MQFQANLGNSTVLSPATRVVNQYNPLGAEGNFATVFDSPSDPNDTQLRIYNLMTYLGNYTLPVGVAGGHLAILGKIQWGIGGTSFEADFDWGMGTQLSLAASFLRVMAAYSEIGDATPPAVRIGAMMSSGSRAARSQVTRSFPKLVFNSGATVLVPIPPYAHALNVFSTDPTFYTAATVKVRYLGGADNGFSAASTSLEVWVSTGAPFLTGLSNEDGVRFPECARFVEFSTTTVATDYHVTPCFTLNF